MGGLPSPMLVGSPDHTHNYLADPTKGVRPYLLLNLCQENSYSRGTGEERCRRSRSRGQERRRVEVVGLGEEGLQSSISIINR